MLQEYYCSILNLINPIAILVIIITTIVILFLGFRGLSESERYRGVSVHISG